ncbi:transcription termination factor Rho [Corynebacterium sp. MC-21]|uniref:Transcription termination factor Rho n=2 Tax=Corynebacteriaceae TaxID=1653 RepID=A0ABS9HH67_9CORY|nr:transcription termination factor Rho [Corynebacterium parakroppenstedtii]MCZ9302712.1 transcription termination factor Rho [Corynebacterium sp. c24U_166]MDU3197427.1 transcription termination factor Rho [Corynebacterium kroppenstedtii]MBY0792092.1 transcription termination factor Rho [Corynebacterium parakroppenstedtii]MBY0796151.1 transcription termination factor Rho [Corynebacterium parakroppenstedtii]MCF6769041.1 transcription termination factor Rho [Corynebacterium parakroppenstedtii]
MTDTDTNNLAAMRIPELKALAAEKGIRGLSGLRKGDIIAAIQAADAGQPYSRPRRSTRKAGEPKAESHHSDNSESPNSDSFNAGSSANNDGHGSGHGSGSDNRHNGHDERRGDEHSGGFDSHSDSGSDNDNGRDDDSDDSRHHGYKSRSQARRARRHRARHNGHSNDGDDRNTSSRDSSDDSDDNNSRRDDDRNNNNDHRRSHDDRDDRYGHNDDNSGDNNDHNGRGGRNNQDHRGGRNNRNDRDNRNDRGGRNNRNDRNNRGNRRNRRNRDNRDNQNPNQLREGETFQPIAGILDVVDNNTAFIRTSGYQSGPNDVYVSMNMVRSQGMRRGDAVTGQIKVREDGSSRPQHGRGRNRQKFAPLARVDTVNGMTPEEAKARPEFAKLTPLYPNQRLRLETDQKKLTTRVIDLIMPIGKGQRALIVSPPKAGKTTILQDVANAITTNNQECYLMVVLVDERPEEVTDMQRSVNGEVIASTFDRPPSEHTTVAELAIERAKRLVEAGQDVVVLLDSITRLGRAYNNSSPASGRILSGGVDSNALYPPKRFLGAARNIENGGSLTIIATAMVETGSAGDTVIFEEFKGTGNAELKLDRKISERRVFPAVDVNPSGTRKDELLLAPDEARVMHKLRRILSALDPQQAIDLLIKQLRKTKNNGEFLMQIASSAPMSVPDDDDE